MFHSGETNVWLMVAVLVVGIVITAIFYYYSGAQQSFRYGHVFVLVTYVGFVFVLIADYAKRADLVPRLYRKRLNDGPNEDCDRSWSKCDKFTCLEHIENTYDYHYMDADAVAEGVSDAPECTTLTDWAAPKSVLSKKCYLVDIESKTTKPPGAGESKKIYALYVRDFYVKAAYNCCASDNFRNGYVNIESMNLAILMGCRFLDFEVYTIDGEPCVATSTNLDSFHYKESFNHLDLDYVLKHVREKAMTVKGCKNYTDPLFLHFRVKTRVPKTFALMARYIQKHFGSSLIGPDFAQDFADDGSPFSLPIESTLGRVFIIFHNYAPTSYFPDGTMFNHYVYKQMGREANELKRVITTWSGNRPLSDADSADYSLREYLYVVMGDPKDNDVLNSLKSAMEDDDSAKSAENSPHMKRMVMYLPTEATNGVTPDSYLDVNALINTHKFFDKEKKNLIQIVPVCIQVYQKKPCNNDTELLSEWFDFFKSALYNQYEYAGKTDSLEVVSTGLRQRVLKYYEAIVRSNLTTYSKITLKPKSINELVDMVNKPKP